MSIQTKVKNYIDELPASKRDDMNTLHQRILKLMPKCRQWFLDGTDKKGKVISNPNIGYGLQVLKQAGGKTREFYQVGISANTTGISVYIMGLDDKNYLPEKYGKMIGKATVTGYCIKFKSLVEINVDVLEAAIKDGVSQTS